MTQEEFELTKKQLNCLNVIRDFFETRHRAPSYREIADGMGLTVSPVQSLLWQLRRKGYVLWEEGKARTLRVLEPMERYRARYTPEQLTEIEATYK